MTTRSTRKALQAKNQLKRKKKTSKSLLEKWKLPDNYSEDGNYFDNFSTPIVDRNQLAPLTEDPKDGTEFQSMVLKKTKEELDERMKEDKEIREKRKFMKQISDAKSEYKEKLPTIENNNKDKPKVKTTNKPSKLTSEILHPEELSILELSEQIHSSLFDSSNFGSIKKKSMLTIDSQIYENNRIAEIPRQRRISILPGIMSDRRIDQRPANISRNSLKARFPMHFDSEAMIVKSPALHNDVTPEDVDSYKNNLAEEDGISPQAYEGKWFTLLQRVKREQLRRHFSPMIDNAEYDDPVVCARENRLLDKLSKSSIQSNADSSKLEVEMQLKDI